MLTGNRGDGTAVETVGEAPVVVPEVIDVIVEDNATADDDDEDEEPTWGSASTP